MMMEICCPTTPIGVFAGKHMLAELTGMSRETLDDEHRLRRTLRSALAHANATVLSVVSKRFEPQGVTVLALLSESHASVHTYPEIGAMFVDVFTCGDKADPPVAIEYLVDALHATSVRTDLIARGHAVGLSALEVPA
jgi:S-adenosylmethionine decarboxylase